MSTTEDFLKLYTFCLFPTRFVSIGDFFSEIPDTAVLIDVKCLVFPQQSGFDWCEVPSFAQQRGFDWFEVSSFSPSNVVLIGAKFQVSLANVVLIGTKCLAFPQQRGFDWYEAKFYVSPSNVVLIDAAILYVYP